MATPAENTANVGSKPSELESIIKSYVWFGPAESLVGKNATDERTYAHPIAGDSTVGKTNAAVDTAVALYNKFICPSPSIVAYVLQDETQLPGVVALVCKYVFQKSGIVHKVRDVNAAHMFFLNKKKLYLQKLMPLDFLHACDKGVKSTKDAKASYEKFISNSSVAMLHNAMENTLHSLTARQRNLAANIAGYMDDGLSRTFFDRSMHPDELRKLFSVAIKLLPQESNCIYGERCPQGEVTMDIAHVGDNSEFFPISISSAPYAQCAQFYMRVLNAIPMGFPVGELLHLAKSIRSYSKDAASATELFGDAMATLQTISGKMTGKLEQWQKEAGQYGIGQPSELVEHIKKLGGLRIEAENNYRQSEEKAKQLEEKARQIQGMLGRFDGVAAKCGRNGAEDLAAYIYDLNNRHMELHAARQSDSNHITALESELAAVKQEKSVLETEAERYEEHREYYAAGQALLAANNPEQLRETVAALRMRATMLAEIERNLVANGGAIDLRGLRRLEEKLRETYRGEGAERRD